VRKSASVQTALRETSNVRAYNVEIAMKKCALLAMTLLLLACDKQGPLERAGEQIDAAVENVKAGGETASNKIDDAIDEAREEIKDAQN
jgi:hypothetical protein